MRASPHFPPGFCCGGGYGHVCCQQVTPNENAAEFRESGVKPGENGAESRESGADTPGHQVQHDEQEAESRASGADTSRVALGRTTDIHARLHRLAPNPGEKCGLKLSRDPSDMTDMERTFTITIAVDTETREITVRDDVGNERSLRSVMIFGGDAEAGDFYLFGWGASADAAWAFKQGFLHAGESGDPAYRNFYKQCACHIAQTACPEAFRQEVEAGQVLDRWQAGDPRKSTLH